jgi:hypothetical protein
MVRTLKREVNKTMSKATKATWTNRRVAKARADRIAVRVNGTVYKSMAKACAALKLKVPANSYAPIRAQIKANGRAKWKGFTFTYAGHPSEWDFS